MAKLNEKQIKYIKAGAITLAILGLAYGGYYIYQNVIKPRSISKNNGGSSDDDTVIDTDTTVYSGGDAAITYLQEVLKQWYSEMKVDGIWGSQTRTVAQNYLVGFNFDRDKLTDTKIKAIAQYMVDNNYKDVSSPSKVILLNKYRTDNA